MIVSMFCIKIFIILNMLVEFDYINNNNLIHDDKNQKYKNIKH